MSGVVAVRHERQPVAVSAVRRMVWVGAALAVLSAVLVGLAVVRAPQMSPFDEWTHADYAWRVAHGQVPAAGTPVAGPILQQLACRGVAGYTLHLPPCDQADPPPAAFPSRGEDYNFAHPPLYYGITGGLARLADLVVPGQRFFVLARLVGILWLWAAMLVLFLALRAFGAPRRHAMLGAAMLPILPGVLRACSTVNNDAAAPLAGAVGLLVLARFLGQNRTGWLFPTVSAFLVAATKVINVLPMLVIAIVFCVLAVLRRRAGDRGTARSMVLVAIGMTAASLVVYKGWALYQAGRGDPNWVSPVAGVSDRPVVGLPFRELTSTLFTGMSPESGYFLPASINGEAMTLLARAWDVAIVAAPLMAWVAWARRSTGWLVGAVTLAGLVAYPLVVEVQVYLSSHMYFPVVNSRYGISMEPWAIACLALVIWKRGGLRLAIGGILAGGAVMLASVAGLA
ncbi:MAG TPA: hypothetical protein VFX70_00010 [Mycobacteriales bacterium]|nr:hypothetical protein [Mycobacteriales bacterium]